MSEDLRERLRREITELEERLFDLNKLLDEVEASLDPVRDITRQENEQHG